MPKRLLLTIALAVAPATVLAGGSPDAETSTQAATLKESELLGMPYPEARKQILDSGWAPRETFIKGPNGLEREHLSAGYFLSLGYTEVEICAGTGLDPCNFNFVDAHGRCLRVSTEGERESAAVAGTDHQCPQADAE